MDEDEDRPPRVPRPREGGREQPTHPVVPAPRRAPALESLAPSTTLTVTARHSGAIALRDDSAPSRWRTLGREVGRSVARLVVLVVDGVRALVEGLAPAPTPSAGSRR